MMNETIYNDTLVMHKHSKHPNGSIREPEMVLYSCLSDNHAILSSLSDLARAAMHRGPNGGDVITFEEANRQADFLASMSIILRDAANDLEGMSEIVSNLDRYRQPEEPDIAGEETLG